jgi:hypothetical protein
MLGCLWAAVTAARREMVLRPARLQYRRIPPPDGGNPIALGANRQLRSVGAFVRRPRSRDAGTAGLGCGCCWFSMSTSRCIVMDVYTYKRVHYQTRPERSGMSDKMGVVCILARFSGVQLNSKGCWLVTPFGGRGEGSWLFGWEPC